ncbi:MAG: type II secretion system F family protein [Alphaproteobacteria bacterium]|nr:type II secretion system F family protein [Alphaproteobacteria bacterium]
MTPQTQMIMVLIGGGLFLVTILALFWPDDGGGNVKKRMARVSGQPVPQKLAQTQTLRRSTTDSEIPMLDRLIKAFLPNPDKLRSRLAQTGRNITLGAYILINALLIVVLFLLFAYVWKYAKVTSILASIALGLFLPHAIVGRMGNKQLSKFLASFPEAIDTICRGLRSGLPITESISAVGQEMPDPIGIEFRRISDSVRMGRSLEDSMWEVSKRLNSPEFRFFIIAMAIQKETGGNLAETLGNLSDLLRKRRQLRSKVRAMSSEARASAMIIGSLPFIMFGLLMLVSPDYILTLTNDPKGHIMLGFAGGMISLGIFVMKQMINFEL